MLWRSYGSLNAASWWLAISFHYLDSFHSPSLMFLSIAFVPVALCTHVQYFASTPFTLRRFTSGPRSRSVTCPYPVAVVNTFTTSPRKKPFIDYVPEVTTSRLRSARIDYSSLHAPPRETPESQLHSESPATANSRRHTPAHDDPEPASPTCLVRTMSGHSNPTESEDEEESRPPRRTVKYTVAQIAAIHEMDLRSRRLDPELKRAKLKRLRNAPLPVKDLRGLTTYRSMKRFILVSNLS
jgi:hypothetical protein